MFFFSTVSHGSENLGEKLGTLAKIPRFPNAPWRKSHGYKESFNNVVLMGFCFSFEEKSTFLASGKFFKKSPSNILLKQEGDVRAVARKIFFFFSFKKNTGNRCKKMGTLAKIPRFPNAPWRDLKKKKNTGMVFEKTMFIFVWAVTKFACFEDSEMNFIKILA